MSERSECAIIEPKSQILFRIYLYSIMFIELHLSRDLTYHQIDTRTLVNPRYDDYISELQGNYRVSKIAGSEVGRGNFEIKGGKVN